MCAGYQPCLRLQGTLSGIASASIARALLTSIALHLFVLCSVLVYEPPRQPVLSTTDGRFQSLSIEATLTEEKATSDSVKEGAPATDRRKDPSEVDLMEIQVQSTEGA